MARKPKTPKPKKLNGWTLGVKRGPDADARWYWRVLRWEDTDEGARKRVSRSIGWLTVEEADKAFLEIASKDETPETEVQQQASATVGHLLKAWLAKVEARQDLATRTQRNYRKGVTRLVELLGDIRLSRLRYGDLEDYRDQRLRGDYSPRTVVQDLKYIRIAWNWARKAGYIDDKPMVVPTVKFDKDAFVINHRTPTAVEVAATLEQLNGWHVEVVQLLWATGARVGEILTVPWDRVDLDDGWLVLKGKTGLRDVPLNDEASEVLGVRDENRVEGQSRVFPEVGAVSYEGALSSLRSAILRACKKAKIEPWTPHGLRRLAVDTMIRSGVEVSAAAAITGHSPEVMLRFYRQVTQADKKAALVKAGLGRVKRQKGQVVEFPGR